MLSPSRDSTAVLALVLRQPKRAPSVIGPGYAATRVGNETSRNICFINVGPNGPPLRLLKATPLTFTVINVLTIITY